MKLSLRMKILTFGLLALLLLSNSAFAQSNESDDPDDDYIEDHQHEPPKPEHTNPTSPDSDVPPFPEQPKIPVVIPQVEGLRNQKISLETLPPRTSEQRDFDPDKAYRAFLNSGHSKTHPNKTDSDNTTVAKPSLLSYNGLKTALKDLYQDSSNLWNRWKKDAGDQWDDKTNTLKEGKDEALTKAYSLFYNVVKDLQDSQASLQDKTVEFTAERQQELAELWERFKRSYESVKQETQTRIEGATNSAKDTVDEGTKAAGDLYDKATEEFYRLKDVLGDKIKGLTESFNQSSEKLSNVGAVSYDVLRLKSKELYNDAYTTLKDLKGRIGTKIDKSTSEFYKKVYSTWGSVAEEMNALQSFFNKNFTKLSDQARSLLDQNLLEIHKYYVVLRLHTETLTKSITDGVSNPEKAVEEAYENALSAYMLARSKIQNEMDYLGGKITKVQYETATGMKRNYERIVSQSYKVLKKIGEKTDHATNATSKVIEPLLQKVREFFSDCASSFVEMDVKLAPYWDKATGELLKVKDDTSRVVRETFQSAIGDFQELEHLLSRMLEEYTGTIPETLKNTFVELEERYKALKFYTQKKYQSWKDGHIGDTELQESYHKAREQFLDSKEHLHVELNKYFDDEHELRAQYKHRDEL